MALLEERDKILDAGRARPSGSSPRARPSTPGWSRSTRSPSRPSTRRARIVGEARAEAQRLRDEVDDYVDTALANFEQFLTRSLASIERGRDKMHALREIGSFARTDDARPACRSESSAHGDSTARMRLR